MPPKSRLPAWLRQPSGILRDLHEVKSILRSAGLRTVCESARCPNMGECFGRRTATFLLLGDVCSRECSFCAVRKGVPSAPDPEEPERIAAAAAKLDLRHVVLTMVTRDDLEDGGASHVADTVESVRRTRPGSTIEVLISDLNGSLKALETVLLSEPDVVNHNIETVPRLYPVVRAQANYQRSLSLLLHASRQGSRCCLKSGLMVGLGETRHEVLRVFEDLRDVGCAAVTVGQYLRPLRACLPVARYWAPAEFADLKRRGRAVGLKAVVASPFVRSSFNAEGLYKRLGTGKGKKER